MNVNVVLGKGPPRLVDHATDCAGMGEAQVGLAVLHGGVPVSGHPATRFAPATDDFYTSLRYTVALLFRT